MPKRHKLTGSQLVRREQQALFETWKRHRRKLRLHRVHRAAAS
jgi:hypothetical protein